MPIITVKVAPLGAVSDLERKVAELAADASTRHLRKRPELTAVIVEKVDPAAWFAGGRTLRCPHWTREMGAGNRTGAFERSIAVSTSSLPWSFVISPQRRPRSVRRCAKAATAVVLPAPRKPPIMM